MTLTNTATSRVAIVGTGVIAPVYAATLEQLGSVELAAVVDELNHQFDDLGREYDRRSADWAHSIKPLTATLLADWRQQLKQCLDT